MKNREDLKSHAPFSLCCDCRDYTASLGSPHFTPCQFCSHCFCWGLERARAAMGLGGRAGQRDPEGLESDSLATPPSMGGGGGGRPLQFPMPIFSPAAPQGSNFYCSFFFFLNFPQIMLVKTMKSVSSRSGTRLVLHLPT